MDGEITRSTPAPLGDVDLRRRDLLALSAVTAIGAGLGPTVAAAGGAATEEHDGPEETGLFLAALTAERQPESVDTAATGGAVFSLTEDGTAIEYALLVSAIEDVNQAHIHLGSAGESGPIAVWLYPDPDADAPEVQAGRFDGILATGTFTDAHLTSEVPEQTVDGLLQEIAAGNAYVNVHTEAHPGGEIRGQVVPVEAVAAALVDAGDAGPEESNESAGDDMADGDDTDY